MDQTFINSLYKLAAKINRSLSKGILTFLQQEQPQKELELGPKIEYENNCSAFFTKNWLRDKGIDFIFHRNICVTE